MPLTPPPKTRFSRLGSALRWMRERRSRTQDEVAAGLGLSAAVLSRIETGHRRPTLEQLDHLLMALDADVLELGLALRIVAGEPGLALDLPEGLSGAERSALAVSLFGFQEFVKAAAERAGAAT